MAKKRKASRHAGEPSGPKELDPADARLKVTSFEDVANSEDEFLMNRDTIMLDDEPNMKRRRKGEEEIEFSDEEVLGYEDSDSNDKARPSKSKRKAAHDYSEDEQDKADGEEGEDSGWWGSSKKEYYNADNIETEADALEEETEAKRIQQKKLSKMAEEDFIFDGDEWLMGEQEAQESAETVTEVLKEVEVTDDMSPEERLKLLSARYPEFDYLVKDFQELQPQLDILRVEAKASTGKSLAAIKYWVLGCYVASLASYLAILTSPARDTAKAQKTIDPAELRDHDVMETLIQCREAWERVKDMRSLNASNDSLLAQDIDSISQLDTLESAAQTKKKTKKAKEDSLSKAKKAKNLAKAKAIEETVADLYDLPINTKSKAKSKDKASRAQDDDSSDFGEEETLDARAAADKAARKKSLKFYTSQIVQKANRRAGAGRDAGGDMDIPHRERLRDRQARLLAEAEKRGKRDSKLGANLGEDSDEEDGKTANAVRDDEDEYYDMVAHASKAKKDDKTARYAAYAAASKADRVVETEEIGEDGKRKITYAIQKNKGLAPRRSKDVRNPRVKRRKQFEAKQKKLKSMKPVWQGGEPKGGYQGEISGINATVIKSTKL
ncbi:sas10, involved in silencing [Trichoderma arundinaceum]|uniref:Sas10, involved in silencing n=1 Tax=Trichoderma arundinaceum TaxID=490622 RepID=A0A395NBC6_TRIAR|nr:sas10, involved in silencing [Trichoderma arundinaceum]